MHFSAFIEVGESVQDPQKYYLNNVSGALNLLNAMQRQDAKRLIFSSSTAFYGEMDAIGKSAWKCHKSQAASG